MYSNVEELLVKKIECGIRGIRMGTKNPEEAKVGKFLNKLKDVNEGLYDDLLIRYMKVYKFHQQKNKS
ncbi:MAG: hypothetical protein ACXAB8_20150 [Promethearchaeota archaeon]|jgi:hypothetical protein